MKAAVLLSDRRYGCRATIFVADRDGKDERRAQLELGRLQSLKLVSGHAALCGLAVESIEAWTLGVPEAIAAELDVTIEAVRARYPAGTHVEALSERSGKPEHRPKALLQRIAQMRHVDDSAEFREAVAARTDIAALELACPQGFGPFAEQLRGLGHSGTQ